MLIETLKLFCDAADLKSFSKAAEANAVTQSAVSQQIRKLEKFWKTNLIDRQNRSMVLTRAGEIFYKEAKAILEHHAALNRMIGRVSNAVGGTLRLSTIYSVGLHELQDYIKRFMKNYPQSHVRVEYKQNAQVYEDVAHQRSDLGIVAYPVEKPYVEVLPFTSDRLVIICPPGHPLAEHKSVRISKIHRENFVAFEERIPTRRAVDEFLRKNGVAVRVTMELDNIETLKRAVEIGAGIGIAPLATVTHELEHKSLKAVEIAGRPLIRPLGILVRKGRNLPVSVGKFIETLTEGRRRRQEN